MIRPAEERDAPGIAAVHVTAWQRAYRGIVPDEVLDGMSVRRRTGAWRGLRAGDDSFSLVAEEDGEVAGFCTVAVPSRDDDAGEQTAEVAAIYVDPERWRTGIGRTLLGAALEELAAGGWREATLWVFAANERALAFYRALGFEPDGAQKAQGVAGRREVRLGVRLQPRSST